MNESQSARFLNGEGDAYFRRNPLTQNVLPGWVERGLSSFIPTGGTVLEVGCGEGRRLRALRALRPDITTLTGVDPSRQAIEHGLHMWPDLDLRVGVAEDLSTVDGRFDLIFFGFCLYLCNREDLFAIADSAHRRLRSTGALAILDFDPPQPARRAYAHLEGLWSFKMDYSKLWTSNPEYVEVSRQFEWAGGTGEERGPFDRLSLVVISRRQNAYLDYYG